MNEQGTRPRRRVWRGVGLVVLAGAVLGLGSAIGFSAGKRDGYRAARAVAVAPAPQPDEMRRLTVNAPQAVPISMPDGRVEVFANVSGPIDAAAVHVASGQRVSGPVSARDHAVIDGTVLSGVQAPVVEIGDRAEVYGPVQGRTVLIHGGVVNGPVTASSVVEISGRVTGTVEAPRVIVHSGAEIQGDLKVGGGQLVLEPGAQVNGLLRGPESGVSLQMPADRHGFQPGRNPGPGPGPGPVVIERPQSGWNWGFFVFPLFGLVAFAGLLRSFVPEQVEAVAAALTRQPRRSLLLGVGSLLLMAAIGGVLAVTIVGIPLALIVALGALAAMAVGIAALADVTGLRLLKAMQRDQSAPLTQSATGAGALGLLLFVPILGWILLGVLLLAGFGAAVGLGWPRVRSSWQSWWERRRARRGGPTPPTSSAVE